MLRNFSMTAGNEGFSALAERMPTIRAGMPADLRVVDACEYMQRMAPYTDQYIVKDPEGGT